MSVLDHDDLHTLHEMIVESGLALNAGIDALLAGLPAGYAATLPSEGIPASRLLRVLSRTNQDGRLEDDEVPIQVVLKNARSLLAGRRGTTFVEELLRRVEGGTPTRDSDSSYVVPRRARGSRRGEISRAQTPSPALVSGEPGLYRVVLTHVDIADRAGLRRLLELAEESCLTPDAAAELVDRAERAPQVVVEGLARAPAFAMFRKIAQIGALVAIRSRAEEAELPRLERTENALPMALCPGVPTENIAPFWLLCHPVTQGQYQRIMKSNPSRFRGEKRPVEGVTWEEAALFCERLSAGEPGEPPYRLPTEAEWEHAANAGGGFPYAGSRHWPEVAWGGLDETRQVRKKSPNAWGLFDMSGNVWEWTSTTERSSDTPSSRAHVVKGGCFSSGARQLEISARAVQSDAGQETTGFRVARPYRDGDAEGLIEARIER